MKLFQNISQNTLFKITSLNSLSVVIKIGIGLITSKFIAYFVGPTGMALVGNFRNFVASIETIATLGFQNGIIKVVAENQQHQKKLYQNIATILITILVTSLLCSFLIYWFADFFNKAVFGNSFQYARIFKAFALALPWYACSIVFLSIINGLGKFKKVIYTNIIGNVLGLFVSVVLMFYCHTFGALLAIIITPSLLFFVGLFFLQQEINCFKNINLASFDWKIIQNLGAYTLMALVSAVISPMVYLIIRNQIISDFGLEQAGFWVTMELISNYYLLFIGTILTVYFLPKLAVAQTNLETKDVFWDYFKNIIPIFGFGLFILFLIRKMVIHLLFSKDFLPVSDLFLFQLLGDVLRACALILGYNLIAKKHTFVFVITEILSMATMFYGTMWLSSIFGIQGVVMAHCLTYAVYLLILVIYFRKSLW